MRINNKGFTLIEMLATITILSIIVIISTASISKIVSEEKDNSLSKTIESIERAAALYVSNNKYNNIITSQISNKCSLNLSKVPIKIDIKYLIDNGFLTNSNKNLQEQLKDKIVEAYYDCDEKKIQNYELIDYTKEENVKIAFNNDIQLGANSVKINVVLPDGTEFSKYNCLYGKDENNLDMQGKFFPEGKNGYCYYDVLEENTTYYFKAILKTFSNNTYETKVANYKTYSLDSPTVEYTDSCQMNKTINIKNNLKDSSDNVIINNPIYYLKLNKNDYTRHNSVITNHSANMEIYACNTNIKPEECLNPIKVNDFNNLDIWYKIMFKDKGISDYSITVNDNLDFSVVLSDGINYKYGNDGKDYSITKMDYKKSVYPSINSINTYTSAISVITNNSTSDMSCGISSYGVKVATYNEHDKNCNTTDLRSKTVYSGNTTNLLVTGLKAGTNAPIHYLDRKYCYAICMKNVSDDITCNSINSTNYAELKKLNAPAVTSSKSGTKKNVTIKFDNNIMLNSGEGLYIYSSLGATANMNVSKCLLGKTLCSSSTKTITKNKWYKLKNTKEITLTYNTSSAVAINTYTNDGASTLNSNYNK